MEKNKIEYVCEKCLKKISLDRRQDFNLRLRDAPDTAFEPLINARLKSASVALLLSFFFGAFAAGKLYIGETRAAITKIAVTFLLGFMGGLLSIAWTYLYLIGVVPAFIWWIVDIVQIRSHTARVNTESLFTILYSYKKER